jgi:hypothetical protein
MSGPDKVVSDPGPQMWNQRTGLAFRLSDLAKDELKFVDQALTAASTLRRDGRPMHDAVDAATHRAVRATRALFASLVLLASVDDYGDRISDEQVALLLALEFYREPAGFAFPEDLVDLLLERVADGVFDLEDRAGVDHVSHQFSPSVGARVLDTPDAAGPTVGAPNDTSAVPSAVGVSLDSGALTALLQIHMYTVTTAEQLGMPALARALVELGWTHPGTES